MKIINLTPHSDTVMPLEGKHVTFEAAGQIARRLDTEVAGRRLTLGAAGVVFAVDQTAAYIGVDDDDVKPLRHRYGAGFQAAAVDQ